MRFEIVTIFPAMIEQALATGVVGRAIERGTLTVAVHDLRDYTSDRHRTVDDTPYGGGAGMVMKPEPWAQALEAVVTPETLVIFPSPAGEVFTQATARELAEEQHLVFGCGRYEGIDDRVRTGLATREVSIGDYVLSGGEIPAMVLIDAIARLVPGVVGDPESLTQDTFSSEPAGWPQFTRPAEFRGLGVPDVLLSGDHARIRQWRRQQAAARHVSQIKELKKT